TGTGQYIVNIGANNNAGVPNLNGVAGKVSVNTSALGQLGLSLGGTVELNVHDQSGILNTSYLNTTIPAGSLLRARHGNNDRNFAAWNTDIEYNATNVTVNEARPAAPNGRIDNVTMVEGTKTNITFVC